MPREVGPILPDGGPPPPPGGIWPPPYMIVVPRKPLQLGAALALILALAAAVLALRGGDATVGYLALGSAAASAFVLSLTFRASPTIRMAPNESQPR